MRTVPQGGADTLVLPSPPANCMQFRAKPQCLLIPQDKNSNRICARGIIDNPHEEIESLRNQHGSQKGKNFRIWADRVRSIKLSDDSWLVRFDKWERSGMFLDVVCKWHFHVVFWTRNA